MKELLWIITDASDGAPIICSKTEQGAIDGLFKWMGFDSKFPNNIEYLGYTSIDYSEFEDDLKGVFTFKTNYPFRNSDFDVFNLFCLELQ